MTTIMIHNIENIRSFKPILLEESDSYSRRFNIETKDGSFDIVLFSDNRETLLFKSN